jgi:8-amino-3,8-dideoxy-alpha-D-manno-octulosonate transaminase
VRRASADRAGFPWNLSENAGMERDYSKGACPVADSLFERSILLPIPSCLTDTDEREIIQAFEKTLKSCL